MELVNHIDYAMKSILNPILEVLTEINILKMLKQSNFFSFPRRIVGTRDDTTFLHKIMLRFAVN